LAPWGRDLPRSSPVRAGATEAPVPRDHGRGRLARTSDGRTRTGGRSRAFRFPDPWTGAGTPPAAAARVPRCTVATPPIDASTAAFYGPRHGRRHTSRRRDRTESRRRTRHSFGQIRLEGLEQLFTAGPGHGPALDRKVGQPTRQAPEIHHASTLELLRRR